MAAEQPICNTDATDAADESGGAMSAPNGAWASNAAHTPALSPASGCPVRRCVRPAALPAKPAG